MNPPLAGLALAAALGALGLSAYGLLREPPPPTALEARLAALESRVARAEAARAAAAAADAPVLVGHPLPLGGRGASADASRADARGGPGEETPDAEALASLVDEAVAKKAAEIRFMDANKKPSMDVFAETLALDEAQRRAAERAVLDSQFAIRDVLQIPADDGTVFLDELVEVLARGAARPGEDPGRGMRLFGRLLSETIPGTDETYAARIDAVKAGLRDRFRREFSAEQFAAFEFWQMDPTEIQDLPGSPYAEVGRRVEERARELRPSTANR